MTGQPQPSAESAGNDTPDGPRQLERTHLSWNRTLLALLGVGALTVRAGLHLGLPILIAGLALVGATAVLTGSVLRRRRHEQGPELAVSGAVSTVASRALALLVAAAAALTVVVAAVDVATRR